MTNFRTTWGLDMSTSPNKTAAVAIDWSGRSGAVVTEIARPLAAQEVIGLIAANRQSSWAVDVPFGWPDLFVELMRARHDGPLPAADLPADAHWGVCGARGT